MITIQDCINMYIMIFKENAELIIKFIIIGMLVVLLVGMVDSDRK